MSTYAARWSEIDDQLEEVKRKALENQAAGWGKPVVEEKYEAVADGLNDYIQFRNQALAESLKLLKESSSSATAKSQRDKWSQFHRAKGQEAFKRISGLVKDEKEHLFFRTFVESLASQESGFFILLSQSPLAWWQGRTLEWRREFEDQEEFLLDKWEEYEDRDKSIDDKVDDVTKEILEIFQKALQQAVYDNKKAAEKLREIYKGVSMADAASNPATPSNLELADQALDRLDHLVSDAETLAKRYRDAYKGEETIVVLFGKTRASVKEFLDKTNLEAAIDEFEAAKKKSLDLAGQCIPKGQQEDFKRFVELAAKEAEATLDAFEKAYNELINDFRGIFIGPVGDKTVENLVEKQLWDRFTGQVQRLNIQSELKKIYDDAREWWSIPLDGLDDPLRDDLQGKIKKELDRLSLATRRAYDWTHTDAAKFLFLYYPRQRLIDAMKKVKGYLE